MTKNERDMFQRNLMVAVKLIAEAMAMNDPINNLERAHKMVKESLLIILSDDENG